jgi:hypothetical protein
MTPDQPRFEVASGKELIDRYGLTAANRQTIRLDATRVPEQFRIWIPLAERWGIGDDLIREDCVSTAAPSELRELLEFGDAYDEVLDEWLTGPESESKAPSEEYCAFTCLGMAWDLAQLRTNQIAEQGGGGNSAALRASP